MRLLKRGDRRNASRRSPARPLGASVRRGRGNVACGVARASGAAYVAVVMLFQEFCDRLSKYGDKTMTLFADGEGSRCHCFGRVEINLAGRRGTVSRPASW
jgi:hypothetical protein